MSLFFTELELLVHSSSCDYIFKRFFIIMLSNYRSNYSTKSVLSIVWKMEVMNYHTRKGGQGQTPTLLILCIINCDSSERKEGRKQTLSCQCSLAGLFAWNGPSFSPQHSVLSVWQYTQHLDTQKSKAGGQEEFKIIFS